GSGHVHLAGSHHMRLASAHHTHLANGGAPAGFSHGHASWKQNGGTPPGWSHGNKTGWGCSPGSSGCMPPGLANKQTGGMEAVSHAPAAVHSSVTPVSARPRPTPVSSSPVRTLKPTPVSHTQSATPEPAKPPPSMPR